MEATQRVLELEQGRLVYLSAGAGPLVVLTHALGPVAWGQVERLAESCTVAIVDWEETSMDRGMRASFGWFEPLVRALGHARAALCVWSMSGPGAIYFAAERPQVLSRLILVDVAGLGPELPPLRWRDLPHFAVMWILRRPTRGFVRMLWRNWVWQDSLDTRALEDASLRFFRANPDAFGLPGSDDDDDDDESLVDELGSIVVPTQVLVGRHSGVLGPEHGRAAVDRLPDGELVVFEQSAHALQLEEKAKFQEVVAAFVAAGA